MFCYKITLIIYLISFVIRAKEFLEPYDEVDFENNGLNYEREAFSYDERLYVFHNLYLSFDEAKVHCATGSKDGQLVEIYDKKVADFVGVALAEIDFGFISVWVGAQKCSSNSDNASVSYCWSNGNTSVDFDYGPDFLDIDSRLGDDDSLVFDCVGMTRVSHFKITFIPIPCSVARPFVCEDKLTNFNSEPNKKTEKSLGGVDYIIYDGELNWYEASSFCKVRQLELAKIYKTKFVDIIGQWMLQLRPKIEMAWIGGYYSEIRNGWMFIDDSNLIPDSIQSGDDWPPWYGNQTTLKKGCLMLDRHLHNATYFLPSRCERKKSFICQRQTVIKNETLTDLLKDHIFRIHFEKKNWFEAVETCEKTDMLLIAPCSVEGLEILLYIMNEYRQALPHIWLRGKYLNGGKTTNRKTLKWVATWNDTDGFPLIELPEYRIIKPNYELRDDEICLNMDRENYRQAIFYTIRCYYQQPFVCVAFPNATNRLYFNSRTVDECNSHNQSEFTAETLVETKKPTSWTSTQHVSATRTTRIADITKPITSTTIQPVTVPTVTTTTRQFIIKQNHTTTKLSTITTKLTPTTNSSSTITLSLPTTKHSTTTTTTTELINYWDTANSTEIILQ